MSPPLNHWVGVDLDKTLATYEDGQWPAIGEPIPRMVGRVKRMIASGYEVRIMTARANPYVCSEQAGNVLHAMEQAAGQIVAIRAWCKEHIGQELGVTYMKDYLMLELWDDRAVSVEGNTGVCLKGQYVRHDGTMWPLED